MGNAETLDNMFFNNSDFNADLSNWNVSKVTNMSYMFWQAKSFNQDIGNWDVSSVTNMHRMFGKAENLIRILGIGMSQV